MDSGFLDSQASPSGQGISGHSPLFLPTPPPLVYPLCILVPIQSSFAISFSSPLKLRYSVKCCGRMLEKQMQRGRWWGKFLSSRSNILEVGCQGSHSIWSSWDWMKNTQLTKRSAAQDASSALAKSLLSFHPFFPNNSCPLIPCYSAGKNKTSLRLSVFLFFPRVGLITGD